MIKVAIVEDNIESFNNLSSFLKKYSKEKEILFDIHYYDDGKKFVNSLEFNDERFDIIFLDIEMPNLNGLEAAKILRQYDETAILIFTTIMRQYAVNGYSVDAMDYMVKPIEYTNLSLKLDKALKLINNQSSIITLVIAGGDVIRLKSSDVYCIETINHCAIFHTKSGDYKQYNSMKNLEKEYAKYGFLRCSNSYIVNPINITKITNNSVFIDNKELSIGRKKKKEFLKEVWKYI